MTKACNLISSQRFFMQGLSQQRLMFTRVFIKLFQCTSFLALISGFKNAFSFGLTYMLSTANNKRIAVHSDLLDLFET